MSILKNSAKNVNKSITNSFSNYIANLKPGHHLSCIYSSEAEYWDVITPYLCQGFDRNEKMLCIIDLHTPDEIFHHLKEEGIESEKYEKQMVIKTPMDTYLQEGVFNPERMNKTLIEETDKALREGFSALRVFGEISWILQGLPGSERFFEYESKVNNFFHDNECLAICLYDQRHFETNFLLDVLFTHPIVIVGTKVYENFYYVPYNEFLDKDRPRMIYDSWVETLEKRNQAEETFVESSKKFQSIFEIAANLITSVDEKGIIVDCNSRVKSFLGYSKEEIVGSPMSWIIHPDYLEKAKESLQEIMENGVSYNKHYKMVRKDRRLIDVSINSSALRDKNGNFLRTICIIDNITKQKKAESLKEELEKKRENFVWMTGHEIRTPLAVLTGYNDLLRTHFDELSFDKREKIFGVIDNQLKRLERLTTEVTTIAQIERGIFRLEKSKMSLDEFLSNAITPFQHILGTQFEFLERSNNHPTIINGDSQRLQQVIDNIIYNAIKNTDRNHRRIVCSTEIHSDHITINIIDNGAGIAPENLEHIFDQYVTIPTEYSVSGTGMGLYVARQILKAHGGTVTAQSDGIGCGSTFIVTIPR